MSTHSLFSPSAAHRWIACPGSLSFPENLDDSGSSRFADDGTASHHWAALCLEHNRNADWYLHQIQIINGIDYTMDEERAGYIQEYLDDVRRRAAGGLLFVEYRVDLSNHLGAEQGGTADAAIYLPNTKHLVIEDLKYGTGEKVYASYDGKINPQLGLYMLGVLDDILMMGKTVEKFTGVICQPRLGHIDEHTITLDELYAFRRTAVEAVDIASIANASGVATLNPGEKQCRWCKAKAKCPALAAYVADQVKCDFDTIAADPAPTAPELYTDLNRAYIAVPLIEDWCSAVRLEMQVAVERGIKLPGPDGLPYKIVEGQSRRGWADPKAAEAALLGQLPPDKAYQPQEIITAPAAAKLLDKKATKALWKDIFEPLIKKASGKPTLALGSDPRPPYTGAASAEDFEEDLSA